MTIRPDKFWDEYINKSVPVVLRGLVMGSDAVEKWTDIYMNRHFGQIEIQVTKRRAAFRTSVEETSTRMPLRKFLQNYRVEDWYLRGIMPEEMLADAAIPHLINCGPFVLDDSSTTSLDENDDGGSDKSVPVERFRSRLSKEILASSSQSTNDNSDRDETMSKLAQLVEPYLWMSAGDTSSLLHSHPQDNLHCVLDGRKDFILIPVEQFYERTTSTDPEKRNEWRQKLDLYETYKNSDEWSDLS